MITILRARRTVTSEYFSDVYFAVKSRIDRLSNLPTPPIGLITLRWPNINVVFNLAISTSEVSDSRKRAVKSIFSIGCNHNCHVFIPNSCTIVCNTTLI